MRATRLRNYDLLGEQASTIRDPLHDPLYGDLVEGSDGERRFVEIGLRLGTRYVNYRCTGTTSMPALKPLVLKCTLSDWRRWAKGGKVMCTTPKRTVFDSISRHPVFASAASASAAP